MQLPVLYLNENVPVRLVKILSTIGIRAVHTINAGNQGVPDEIQLEYAAVKGYILVTHNRRDFRLLHKEWLSRGKKHAGILLMGHGEPENLASRIGRFLKKCSITLKVHFV